MFIRSQTMLRRANNNRIAGLALAVIFALPSEGGAQAVVLEDFETAVLKGWQGNVQASRERSSHGMQSGRIALQRSRVEVSFTPPRRDWKGFDRLLFDVYSDRDAIQTLSLRVYEDAGRAPGEERLDDYFDARNKLVLLKGWTHVEVKLAGLQAASFRREISLDRIGSMSLYADRVPVPRTVWIDNLRLVKGREELAAASRTQPHDTVVIIENRFYTVRQVARAEDVPESTEVRRLRAEAEQESERLREAIRAAQLQGIETVYAERHLVTADLGIRVRPRLAWYNNDRRKTELFSYVASSCREARRELEDLVGGVVRLPHADDTRAGEPLVPPYPPLKGSPMSGWFYRDRRGDPMFVISLHSPSHALEHFFASPLQHIESYTVGGGSRWTIEESPVYEAFHKNTDARRVGWDGWCGHLIRDLHSMGGSRMENVVICLESPHIREAVDAYIRLNVRKFHENPQLLYDIMAYELMYICYCDRSQKMFQEYLRRKHGSITVANSTYASAYRSFDDVVAPPVKNSRPLPDTNRALWYDWARFNMDRFTDYLLWVKSRIRRISPDVPLAAGGSSSMLAGRTGTTGIDEERIVNEVDDVIIHEGAGSTLGMDLQLALSETPKPLADPEMNLQSVHDLLPHALHGKSVIQFYHWPAQPPDEFVSTVGSSLPHSWRFSLADIGELIRATLDARRLGREIAAFVEAPAEVAILYSQTSTLQLPPEMLTWSTTPYLAELEKTYEASQYLDARVTFVTERQIRKGRLDRYRLLLIPAARNVPADVVERILDYVSSGGRALIVPESFLGDEYNRPEGFLAAFGVTVEKTERPKPGGIGRMVQGYDQSFAQDVSVTDEVRVKLAPAGSGAARVGELETAGVRQRFRSNSPAETLFRYADGSPAVVRTTVGTGAVYYSGASLETRSYSRLLEALFEEAGVARPVRVKSRASDTWKIESRFARLGGRRLLYVTNFHDTPVRLRLAAPDGFCSSLFDLRARRKLASDEVTLEARQTGLFEIV